jgi:2',3'-cyclic-nucleotide 3'-phosphodiesterase
MPGSSLWLVPPEDHPLYKTITSLIESTLPSQFPQLTGPLFAPHMTLSSNIDPSLYVTEGAQQWLDSIPFASASDVSIRFTDVKTQDFFFRRCYISVELKEGVRQLAGIARARGVLGEEEVGEKTKSWLEEWEGAFGPHVSLI